MGGERSETMTATDGPDSNDSAPIAGARADELDELHRSHRPGRHLSLIGAWLSGWLRRQTPTVCERLPVVETGEIAVTFGGHATVLLRWPQLQVVLNPMLGSHIGPSRRLVQAGIEPQSLAACDLVLITHASPETLHLPTLRHIPTRATIVVPPRCAGLVSRLGFARVVELGIGSSLAHRGVEIASAAVRHRGPACAYILRGPGPSVFYCADSGYFSGFADVGARHRPDLALLPISGYAPRSFRDEHLSPLDALYAFEDLHARLLIPIRYGSFVLSYERVDEPLRWLQRLIAERGLEAFVTPLPPGRSVKFRTPGT